MPDARVGNKRAIALIVKRLGFTANKAEKFVRKTLGRLEPHDFYRREAMAYANADSYAVEDHNGAWYVKFYVDNGQLVVTSCHEPEEDMLRADGKTVRKSKS